jgi:hypothetical protein
MVRISVGERYTTHLAGQQWKFVICEYCGCRFLYKMKIEAQGAASSPLWLFRTQAKIEAQSEAYNNFYYEMEHGVRARSCPNCGYYQKEMEKRLIKKAWKKVWDEINKLFIIGIVVLFISFFILIVSRPLAIIFFVLYLLFSMLRIIQGVIHASTYHPNSNSKKRIGRKFSEHYPVLKEEEFDLLQKKESPN